MAQTNQRRNGLETLIEARKQVLDFKYCYLAAECMCDIVIRRKDGKNALIEKVLYVLGMMCNLLVIGKLVENGFYFITTF